MPSHYHIIYQTVTTMNSDNTIMNHQANTHSSNWHHQQHQQRPSTPLLSFSLEGKELLHVADCNITTTTTAAAIPTATTNRQEFSLPPSNVVSKESTVTSLTECVPMTFCNDHDCRQNFSLSFGSSTSPCNSSHQSSFPTGRSHQHHDRAPHGVHHSASPSTAAAAALSSPHALLLEDLNCTPTITNSKKKDKSNADDGMVNDSAIVSPFSTSPQLLSVNTNTTTTSSNNSCATTLTTTTDEETASSNESNQTFFMQLPNGTTTTTTFISSFEHSDMTCDQSDSPPATREDTLADLTSVSPLLHLHLDNDNEDEIGMTAVVMLVDEEHNTKHDVGCCVAGGGGAVNVEEVMIHVLSKDQKNTPLSFPTSPSVASPTTPGIVATPFQENHQMMALPSCTFQQQLDIEAMEREEESLYGTPLSLLPSDPRCSTTALLHSAIYQRKRPMNALSAGGHALCQGPRGVIQRVRSCHHHQLHADGGSRSVPHRVLTTCIFRAPLAELHEGEVCDVLAASFPSTTPPAAPSDY